MGRYQSSKGQTNSRPKKFLTQKNPYAGSGRRSRLREALPTPWNWVGPGRPRRATPYPLGLAGMSGSGSAPESTARRLRCADA